VYTQRIYIMLSCEICDKVFSDKRDIEECDTCDSSVCISCIIDNDTGSEVYCSEECRA